MKQVEARIHERLRARQFVHFNLLTGPRYFPFCLKQQRIS